jgi:hypothetical protein
MPEITREQVFKLCLPGSGEKTCAYLTMGPGWNCAKGESFERAITQRAALGLMTAKGNNCSGPPEFKPLIEIEAEAIVKAREAKCR